MAWHVLRTFLMTAAPGSADGEGVIVPPAATLIFDMVLVAIEWPRRPP